MRKILVKKTIDVSADKVWETIGSFENPERFVPTVISSTVNRTDNSTQRTCAVQFGNQEGKLVEQLNLVDDEHKVLEFTIQEGPPPVKGMQMRWQIINLAENTSEIQISTNFENDNPEVVQTIQGLLQMMANGLKNFQEAKR